MCHKSDAKGNQLKHWQESKHAKAYEMLASKEAKDLAAKVGVKGDPQKAPECLKCHTAGFGADAALLGEKFKIEDGVQCERCHGAGADYAKVPIMKDRAKSVANGLIIPTEAMCRQCHNETAPRMGDRAEFNFKEAWKKIAHPRPKEAPAKK
ncbi:MAG: hypothetical protein A3G34_15860 [Candidatus Lindowbacteria bacterium RIFCSPLOWO2_12_FULL_62_27]|nr:MAG: hypothetical protein A3G34_15860 [Candidatus Lindowbacteria bacterium RIFCSPLOWO2_12_FULL_62_27]